MRVYILLTLLALLSCVPKLGVEDELDFSIDKWNSADKDGGEREMMLKDLKENHLQIGMPMDSVYSLLGQPDTIIYNNEFKYLLSISYDPCFLSLKFVKSRLESFNKECD